MAQIHFNRLYGYIKATELEKTNIATDPGCSLLTACRISKLLGMVTTGEWDYAGSPWPPPPIPEEVDEKAARRRRHHYYRLRDEDEIKRELAAGHPVQVTLKISDQWRTALNGVIELPKTAMGINERHAVVLYGYNDDDRKIPFINSWGAQWGNAGWGELPYGYFNEFGIESFAVSAPYTHFSAQCIDIDYAGLMEYRWVLPTAARGTVHGIQVVDPAAPYVQEAGWVFMCVEKDWVQVDEFFIAPKYRGRRFARRLFSTLERFCNAVERPPCIWISHTDSAMLGPDLLDLAFAFGLRLEAADKPWSYKRLIPKSSPPLNGAEPQEVAAEMSRARATFVAANALEHLETTFGTRGAGPQNDR